MADVIPSRVVDRSQFADALTRLRESAGLSVRDVARAAGIPVATMGDYFSGRALPATRGTEVLSRILRTCGAVDRSVVSEWLAAFMRVRRTTVPPYRGGEPYRTVDADWFFGRGTLVRDLVGRLDYCRAAGRPLLIAGRPGAGVSSVLRAGVVPALAGRAALMVLGGSPCRQLADVLSMAGGAAVERLDRMIHCRPDELSEAVGDALSTVVVDRFERVVQADGESAHVFRTALISLSRNGVAVLIGAKLGGPAIDGEWFEVTRMTDDELRGTIELPARRARLTVPAIVAGAAMTEVAHLNEPLPLLSRVMLETWRRREGTVLTERAFEAAVSSCR